MAEERHCFTGQENAAFSKRDVLNLQVYMTNERGQIVSALGSELDSQHRDCQMLVSTAEEYLTFPIWSGINCKLWVCFKIIAAQPDSPLPSQAEPSLFAPSLKPQTVKPFLALH